MKTFRKMLKIEGKLSIRDMNMVIFAIAMPLIVQIILGMVYGTKPAFSGANYSFVTQSFGALSTISICAGGLMGLPLAVADIRERKILKRFKVTPIHPAMILFVYLSIYVLYALSSVITLWIVGKLFFHFSIKGSILLFVVGWLFVLISILSIGMLAGGVSKNTKQASVIASILYFPMLIFSGATLPYEAMPKVMQKIVNIMPLTQGIKILKAAVVGETIHNIQNSIVIMFVIMIVCIILSIRFFKWE